MTEQTTRTTIENQDETRTEPHRQPGTGDIVRAMDQLPTTEEEKRARNPVGVDTTDTNPTPLLAAADLDRLRTRWNDIQTSFVDEPRQSVEQADALVAEVIKQVAQVFAGERSKLEDQWSRGGDVSTEDLRVALRRYRSFFDRLLSL